jgi:hypothetical protein
MDDIDNIYCQIYIDGVSCTWANFVRNFDKGKTMKNFKNKVAAITGAGSGMGQQLAILLAKAGCHLSIRTG